jgi:hypothetical protein
MPLSSEEIQRRRALISKLKEETISHEEALELICLLEKERRTIPSIRTGVINKTKNSGAYYIRHKYIRLGQVAIQ